MKYRHVAFLDEEQSKFIDKLCEFHKANPSQIFRMLIAEAMRKAPEPEELTEK